MQYLWQYPSNPNHPFNLMTHLLDTSSVQAGNLCAQLFTNSIFSLLTASCLSFSSDPKKIQNISFFHQTFVYGWISIAIASNHQIPHHNRWCLPLWHSPRLTISLSLSLSSGFLCFLLLSSPTVAELLLPLTPIAVGGASHRRHNHWWLRVQLSYSLFSFSFILFFSIFICLLDKTETPLTLIFFHFFISLMNKILFQFWLAWWMGFLVWTSGISNNCYYWHF